MNCVRGICTNSSRREVYEKLNFAASHLASHIMRGYKDIAYDFFALDVCFVTVI